MDELYELSQREFQAYLDRYKSDQDKAEHAKAVREYERKLRDTVGREDELNGGSRKIRKYADSLFEDVSRSRK